MERYFRIQSEDEDAEELLDPENQESRPWGGADPGPCDKCAGSGRTEFVCESCRAGADPGCPVCEGEIRYVGRCPACRGSGEITDEARRGVSVFPDEDGLYRYMARRGTELDGRVLVELEGERSDDEDFDADEGALLVFPRRIVTTREPDRERAERIRRDLEPSER